VDGWRGSAAERYGDQRKPSSRRLRLLVLVLVPVYLAFVTAAASAVHSVLRKNAPAHRPTPVLSRGHAAASADPGLIVVNKTRANKHRPPLVSSSAAVHLARAHSLDMAREQRVFQESCVECMNWRMMWGNVEENVGSGSSVQAAYQDLMHGRTAWTNVLCRCVTQGGTAVARSGGRVWVTGIFFRPGTGTLLGARAEPQATYPVVTGDPDEDALVHFESEIGRKVAIDHIYVHVGTPLPFARFAWDRANGRVPLVDWDVADPAYSWARIAAGKADAIIDATARAVAAYDHPILISFDHEPLYSAFVPGRPAQFVAAWRHIVDRFRAARANNAFWVLILTASTYDQGIADLYFPGRSYVNFLAADGYNWKGALHKARWRSFADIFTSFYYYTLEKRLPGMITEAGSLEDPNDPGRKAAWFRGADAWLHRHPNIKAFVYFNTTVRWPWWIDTSPQSLAAFRALANDPLFRNPMSNP
jgi:uncharacterized protein YkwD